MRIGVDTGGTFTDFVLEKEGGLRFHKVVSTPHNPAEAVCRGIDELGESLYPGDEVIHGTTVATNGFLERKGARTALITTRGFRDLLCIGRQNRPELYNLQVKKVAPFIRPSWVFEVNERTLADGTLVRKPENGHLGKLQHKLIQGRFESIAVVFLHSYVNPTNEELVGAGLQDLGLPVSLSSKILPEFREYERLSTTCINAYLGPLLSHYFRELEQRLRPVVLLVQQSNGGHMTVPEAAERPVHTILSGPAGGLAGARKIADFLGEPRIITFDMGGTSTDVALSDGDLPYTREYRLDDFPVGVQVLDIHTIGAGGGSIAWLDRAGALRVGPKSAGADPGPVCYGKGNELTVTDANLFLGRLLPDYFLGGGLTLYPERTEKTMRHFASRLGVSALQAAEGIVAVANANMNRALRAVSVERGYHPRDYVLVCLGGASGLHACELALELNIHRIILPIATGVLSALGMVSGSHRRDLSRTVLLKQHQFQTTQLEKLFQTLESDGFQELARTGIEATDFSAVRKLDVRYYGQSYEIPIPHTKDFVDVFHQEHERLFGHAFLDRDIEITTLRLSLETESPVLSLPRQGAAGQEKLPGYRPLYYAGTFVDAAISHRTRLQPGQKFAGPALILDDSSTCLVTPEFVAQADIHGNLHLERMR
ncbi:MAG: hydantoinase/oxoprolinase family protein [Syntrophobacterales bacterium]|jgi:N-methylhydantoinase A/oxoprolinase/acetone carboxylase beta subunit